MDDRIAEIREALAWWENAVYMELSEQEEDHVRGLAGAARKWLDLLDSDALIIRRDEFYQAAIQAKWPYEVDAMLAVNWKADGVNLVKRDIARSILDALASSQGVEPQ